MSSRKNDTPTTLKEFLDLLERYSRVLAEFRETPRGEVIRRWELNKWAEECREKITRSAEGEKLHLLWELEGIGLENPDALLTCVRKWRAALCPKRTESEVNGLSLKDFVAETNKDRKNPSGGDSSPPTDGRLKFDDQTQTVTLDGKSYQIEHAKAYCIYKAIADACPAKVTNKYIRARVPGLNGRNAVSQCEAKLPTALKRTIRTDTGGKVLRLPKNGANS
jgi:hypothetical protein